MADLDLDLESFKQYCKDDEAYQKLKSKLEDHLEDQDEKIAELKQKEQYLRLVLDLDPSFIFARDKDGEFKLANQALAESYGMRAEDLIGKTDADFIDDQAEVHRILTDDQEVMETWEEKVTPERKIVDVNGRERWLRIIKSPLLSSKGELEQVLAVALDITEQKKASLQFKKLKERYQALVLAKAEFIWVMDSEGNVEDPSDSWLDFTGQTAEEMKGRGWLNVMHVDERERFKRMLERAFQTHSKFETQCRIRDRDYNYHYFNVWAVPVVDDDDNVKEWVAASSSSERF